MNQKERDLRKAAEECSELVTVLIQQLNKPRRNFSKHIIEEIGDVLFRVENLRKHFDSDAISRRIDMKRKRNEDKHK
tara:strand:- start:480 stop:710 length:231 start_codon:yes stop_codon:yes gene_type:complete